MYTSIASVHGFPDDFSSLEHEEQPKAYPNNQGLQSCHNIYTGDGQRQENPLSTVDTNKSWEISTSPHLCIICYNAHKVSLHCQHDHLTHVSSELRQNKHNNYTRHKQTWQIHDQSKDKECSLTQTINALVTLKIFIEKIKLKIK